MPRSTRLSRNSRKAEVQRFRKMTVQDYLVTKERAVLPCGCCLFVGLNGADPAFPVAVAAQPCKEPGHERVTDRSTGLLREAQQNPSSRKLLVVVCAEVLSAAAREFAI